MLAEGGQTMTSSSNPKTVEEVFKDFTARRQGMLKALTTEVEEFYRRCDPEKENLCLYGFPEGTWAVNLPAEEVPPELPEPALGINFARDGMQRKDWLSLVAVHSDAWLLAVAFYFGARFDKTQRKKLFGMINESPTLFEVVTGRDKPVTNNAESKGKSSGKSRSGEAQTRGRHTVKDDDEEDEDNDENDDDGEEDHGETHCGLCGGPYGVNEFWIGCDVCEKWYHGKCVKITPARAEHIKHYKCPSCSKRGKN